jgi:hypothetical protein
MGVATGTFQLANGSPVASGLYQWKLSQDAVLGGTTSVGPPLITGLLDTNGNMTATFVFNDVLNTATGQSTFYQLTVKDITGRQVWNEMYYLAGAKANLNNAVAGPGGILVVSIPTYRSTSGVPASTAGVIVTVQGSATKTVKIVKTALTIGGASAESQDTFTFGVLSSITGGTATPVVAQLMNSGDGSATAVVTRYTGTAPVVVAKAVLGQEVLSYPALTAVAAGLVRDWSFGNNNDEPITVNGVNEWFFVADLSGAGSFVSGYVTIEWTEQ